jgi:hypothetical protein
MNWSEHLKLHPTVTWSAELSPEYNLKILFPSASYNPDFLGFELFISLQNRAVSAGSALPSQGNVMKQIVQTQHTADLHWDCSLYLTLRSAEKHIIITTLVYQLSVALCVCCHTTFSKQYAFPFLSTPEITYPLIWLNRAWGQKDYQS